MGPRLIGRGKEITHRTVQFELFGFNGAAADWPRKACPNGGKCAVDARFNGAAADWPRKGRSMKQTEICLVRFNGAAADWPRKAASYGECRIS